METTLAVQGQQDIQQRPMDMVQYAISQNASIETIREMYALKREYEADEARKAFNVAMAEFKANPPRISKNKHVRHNNFYHATLDECVEKITPALAAVGIRHRWDVDQSHAPNINVTCILSHRLGHSESTAIKSGADTSGSKNAIQAVGSAVTYLQRYTLLAATGLAATDTDDDGKNSGPRMEDKQYVDFRDKIAGCRSLNELQEVFKPIYKAAQEVGDKAAMADLIKSKDERKAELS